MRPSLTFISLWLIFSPLLIPQNRYAELGSWEIVRFSSAPFPHPLRSNGHRYGSKTYPAADHYQDSSTAIFVPSGFVPGPKTDLVIYFHGWYNSIDSAAAQFRLVEQFAESGVNALFVFPEGPKYAPDSFGGRLEEKGGLQRFVADVMIHLRKNDPRISPTVGNIILAGHSGAYRVIAYSLLRGGVTENISGVLLFDGLYGDTEKFAYWIGHSRGRFINIYTNGGGTKQESENLMECLDGWNIPYRKLSETEMTPEDLRQHRLIFLHSDLGHNGVIAERNQFREFLKLCMPVKGKK